VGVIGCRGIGVRHGNGVQGIENAELVAGCDLVDAQLRDFDERFGATNPNLVLYKDFEEMLEKANLDILTVATGDNRHTDPVVAAAEAGVKGIFCEKPLAVSVEASERMVDAVEKNDVVFSVDHTRHWFPLWHRCHELVCDGAIGKVGTVIATHTGPRSMLFRNGTHILDAIYWFAGAKPEWIVGKIEDGYEDYSEYRGDGGHDPDTEPSANAYIHFANGVRGNYIGEKKTQGGVRLEVMGTDGRLYIGDTGDAHIEKDGELEKVDVPVWEVEGIEAGVHELVRVLEGKAELSCTIYDGQVVVDMMLGILQSQQEGNGKAMLKRE
ncbi:MAG: Gfo/Idh/MocA family oxidoreductase, partial [Candidatus Latescibacteria bacterium]|nr:Gfo/Idh/MocA family oxidoreductase [Candidatus Latescibacterota bacterium]